MIGKGTIAILLYVWIKIFSDEHLLEFICVFQVKTVLQEIIAFFVRLKSDNYWARFAISFVQAMGTLNASFIQANIDSICDLNTSASPSSPFVKESGTL